MLMDADIRGGESVEFYFILNLKPVYAPALANWMLVSDSISFNVNTSIWCALNVSQRAEMGSAKEIREEKSTGQRGRQQRDFESVSEGENLGRKGEKGEKVREDNTYENA